MSIMLRRFPAFFVAAALVAAQALAIYPQPNAAWFWLAVALVLLGLAARGRRWALSLLAAGTTFGALLLLVAGAGQVTSHPRYLLRGIALAVAALPLLQAWRAQRSVV